VQLLVWLGVIYTKHPKKYLQTEKEGLILNSSVKDRENVELPWPT